MGLTRLTTSPAPVLTPELTDHLRLDDSQDDGTLQNVLDTATDYLERETRQALRRGTFRLSLDYWPDGRVIVLPVPPLASVEAVEYLDPATGSYATLPANTYRVDTDSRPGRIVLKSGLSWPATTADGAAVRVSFTAGYSDTDLPFTLRQGVLLLAGHFFENREAAQDRTISQLPLAIESIVAMHQFPEAV